MVTHRFLVSVFDGGKNVNSFFSKCLDDLATIRAIHKGCEITIFDLENFAFLDEEQVEIEVRRSGQRLKQSLERRVQQTTHKPKPVISAKEKRKKQKKYWDRRVMCVETGQIFPTIRDCSEKTGIPYMTINNCIRRGNATRGVHFINYSKEE